MRIHLENVEPQPLRGEVANSEVWHRDITISAGQCLLFKAASGKGKTTLLSIIFGLRRDYQGKVTFEDADIRSFGRAEWSRVRQTQLAYVFQDFQLFDELTAWENVTLKNQLTGYRTVGDLKSMFQALGLENKIGEPVARLSRGQKQRVAVIRALCQPFAFLLLDEPFSHLDRETMGQTAALIRSECQKQGAGILLASLEADTPLAGVDIKKL